MRERSYFNQLRDPTRVVNMVDKLLLIAIQGYLPTSRSLKNESQISNETDLRFGCSSIKVSKTLPSRALIVSFLSAMTHSCPQPSNHFVLCSYAPRFAFVFLSQFGNLFFKGAV